MLSRVYVEPKHVSTSTQPLLSRHFAGQPTQSSGYEQRVTPPVDAPARAQSGTLISLVD